MSDADNDLDERIRRACQIVKDTLNPMIKPDVVIAAHVVMIVANKDGLGFPVQFRMGICEEATEVVRKLTKDLVTGVMVLESHEEEWPSLPQVN